MTAAFDGRFDTGTEMHRSGSLSIGYQHAFLIASAGA